MQFVGKMLTSVSEFYRDINPSTLSGAIDIIVVEDVETGEWSCSPFHVRFGKFQLLRPQDKAVQVAINGRIPLGAPQMKVGEAGETFWVLPLAGDEQVDGEYATSPLSLPIPEEAEVPSIVEQMEGKDESLGTFGTSGTLGPLGTSETSGTLPTTNDLSKLKSLTAKVPLKSAVSDSEIESIAVEGKGMLLEEDDDALKALSDSEVPTAKPPSPKSPSRWTWGWGGLPKRKEEATKVYELVSSEAHLRQSFKDLQGCLEAFPEQKPSVVVYKRRTDQIQTGNHSTLHEQITAESTRLGPEDFWQNPWAFLKTEALAEMAVEFFLCDRHFFFGGATGMALAIGMHLLGSTPTAEQFEALLRLQFPKPTLESKPPPSSWRWWGSSSSAPAASSSSSSAAAAVSAAVTPATVPETVIHNKKSLYKKSLRLPSEALKRLGLQAGMNTITFTIGTTLARSGIDSSTAAPLQQQSPKFPPPQTMCTSRIFLWRSDAKLVISDIDGTITKSDALGHLFTLVGRDWTHSGVAKLYTEIHQNGYQFVYLTSRAIGQAQATRMYLRGIEQGSSQLPDGPVIMSPDRLFAAVRRELIEGRPEEFKIACLQDIRQLFHPPTRNEPLHYTNNPFHAGFGNRTNDALSYRSVGVPTSRIFIINPSGDLRFEQIFGYTGSYGRLTEMVDQIFPPLLQATTADPISTNDSFGDLSFWRQRSYLQPAALEQQLENIAIKTERKQRRNKHNDGSSSSEFADDETGSSPFIEKRAETSRPANWSSGSEEISGEGEEDDEEGLIPAYPYVV